MKVGKLVGRMLKVKPTPRATAGDALGATWNGVRTLFRT